MVPVLVTASFGFGVVAVRAAPLTGVVFVAPTEAFSGAISAGTTTVTIPQAPTEATQALVHISMLTPNSQRPVLMLAHPCDRAGQPATDGVLAVDAPGGFVSNDLYVDVAAGVFCVTTTDPVRLTVDVEAWVTPSGAAYVDVPIRVTTSVTGPTLGTPLDLSAAHLPGSRTGVALLLEMTSSSFGSAYLFPCGQSRPLFAQASWAAGGSPSVVVPGVALSSSGLCIDIVGSESIDVSVDGYYATGVAPTQTSPPQVHYTVDRAPGFVGVEPTRLFDTRTTAAPVPRGQAYRLNLAPFVPQATTTAVTVNVTATEPAGSGYITVYPCDQPDPPPTPKTTSSLNFIAGETVPNLITVDVGSTLEVCFYASETTHLLADLAGYYELNGGDGFTPSRPVRLFDTRRTSKLAATSTFEFDLSKYVPVGATSVVFNLTATEASGSGYITAYPCGPTPPLASNLNVSTGQTVPNLVTMALSPARHVCFYTQTSTNLVADLAGWYSPAGTSGFFAIPPVRWIDTRSALPAPLPANSIYPVDFSAAFPDATAMVFNTTVTEPTSAGYLTAFPCAPTPPRVSNVNFIAGQTTPNMTISTLDNTGKVCLYNSAQAHWIVDVSGYFTDSTLVVPYFPAGTDEF
jgi:hypothetical protein